MLNRCSTSRSFLRVASIVAIGALASCLVVANAEAARVFPANSRQVKITEVGNDMVVADGKVFHLAPGVLIYTTNNTTLVRGALPENIIARMQLDGNGDVRRVWILTDAEILVRPWWQFWKREQPQTTE